MPLSVVVLSLKVCPDMSFCPRVPLKQTSLGSRRSSILSEVKGRGCHFDDTPLGKESKNQNGNLRLHLPLGVRPPPPLMAKFPDIFLPHFFSFAIESYIYETDFTLQKYHF